MTFALAPLIAKARPQETLKGKPINENSSFPKPCAGWSGH